MAMTEAFKEAIGLLGLVSDLGILRTDMAVFYDNQSTNYLVKNQLYHAKTKHIGVRYDFIRDIIDEVVAFHLKINTKDNLAEMLTKIVTSIKFKHCL